MNFSPLQPVTGSSVAVVTVTPETESSTTNVSSIKGEGFELHVVRNERATAFVGAVDNIIMSNVIHVMSGSKERMLVDAINNRTRERNYYLLYSRLLENEITEEDFDRIIDENPDDYVISTDKIPTEAEFADAIMLADYIKGIETTGDIETLFSFRGKEFNDLCKRLLNESL